MQHEQDRTITRRSFTKFAALAAAGTVTAGATAAEAGETQVDWAGEADVIVMGFGGAGASASVEAARQGASVLVFEKAPEQYAGGNSSVCDGGCLMATDREPAFEAVRRTTTTTSVSDEEIYAFVDNTARIPEWLKEACDYEVNVIEWPADWANLGVGAGFGGLFLDQGFYGAMANAASTTYADSITISYESPVVDLIVNHDTNEVLGVTVEGPDGTRANYKARKGVILACGSFEANDYMIENFCYDPLPEMYPLGSPYNTGDGFALLAKVGAQLRHCATVEHEAFCFRVPTRELGVTIAMKNSSADDVAHMIFVNRKGQRFLEDEAARTQATLVHPGHEKATMPELHYDGMDFAYDNLPFWFVFDNDRFTDHALATYSSAEAESGWTYKHNLYCWSEDNEAELERGWILKADTIAELAELMGVDAATLEATVEAYNETERGQESPVAAAPFYATEMVLAFVNCQGGPLRNADNQVMGYDGNPVPRLYAAGEFGSIWGRDYHGALNVPEAICGFAVGEKVASLEAWA